MKFSVRFPGCGKSLAAAVLAVVLLLGMQHDGWGRTLRAGTEVFAVDPDLVVEVSYRTSARRMMAHRWQSGDPFTLVFWVKGQLQPDRCLAGEGFAAVLRQLTSLKLCRTLDAGQAREYFRKKPLDSWDELMIRDTSALEPFRALLLPVEGPATEALVHFQGITCVVDFKVQVFSLISGGCQTLGVAGAPKAWRPGEKPPEQ